jgi:methylaspartate ammonia-lyase
VLEGHEREIKEIISKQKEEIEDLKKKRNEVKATDISLNKKKEKYNQITQQQNKLRQNIKTLKITLKNLKSEVVKDTNEIIESIPLFGTGGDATKKLIQQKLLKKHKQEIINQNNQNEDISFLKKETQKLEEKLSQNTSKTHQIEELNDNLSKTIANLENSIKTYKNNIKKIEHNSTFNYISELEKLKEQSELQYNKEQKDSQIKKQQLKDLTKLFNKKITPSSPSL